MENPNLCEMHQVAVRLADEGIPMRAIVRATKIPSDDLRGIITDAKDTGIILQVPREDWPPLVSREKRLPEMARLSGVDEDSIRLHLSRLYKVTQQQALLLWALVKRREATREQLHGVIESKRRHPKVETNLKLVDVVVCKLRKRLTEHKINLLTVHSCGYYMPILDRKQVLATLEDAMGAVVGLKIEGPAPVAVCPVN